MKITKKDASLLLGVLGVLIFVVVYYYVFVNFSDKTEELQAQNKTLKTKVHVLQKWANDREDLLIKIDENKAGIAKILERFPADVREEDAILLAVKLQDEAPIEYISNVVIENPIDKYTVENMSAKADARIAEQLGEPVSSEAESTAEETGDTDLEETMPGTLNLNGNYKLMNRTVEITSVATYEGFKEAIRMITNRQDRTEISVMASYDIASGLVDSRFILVTDYMTGTGKLYEAPNIPFISQGTNNIFGTIDLRNRNVVTEETDENAGASEATEQ